MYKESFSVHSAFFYSIGNNKPAVDKPDYSIHCTGNTPSASTGYYRSLQIKSLSTKPLTIKDSESEQFDRRTITMLREVLVYHNQIPDNKAIYDRLCRFIYLIQPIDLVQLLHFILPHWSTDGKVSFTQTETDCLTIFSYFPRSRLVGLLSANHNGASTSSNHSSGGFHEPNI